LYISPGRQLTPAPIILVGSGGLAITDSIGAVIQALTHQDGNVILRPFSATPQTFTVSNTNESKGLQMRISRLTLHHLILTTIFSWSLCGNGAAAQSLPPGHIDDFAGKPRVVVLSDIGNEPDDQMSFVRLLLYSNELDLEALTATTSTWQKNKVQPETMHDIVAAYGKVRANLLKHAQGWPEAAQLDAAVTSGQPAYGMAAVGPEKMSPGAEAIIRAADRNDTRPLWITIWGGANTLAQALQHVRATRSGTEVDSFVAKLRVYSISDQDDAGPWIRREFPALQYIVKPSSPDSGEYASATWTGISGDVYYRNCMGADGSTVTNEWLESNIRPKGPLGKFYPKFAFIMEGDTPAYLGLTNNGLNSYRNPSWGGWGGRYIWRQPYGETHPIWTQGGDLFPRVTSQDSVVGADGKTFVSDQATIWRWRTAFQHEFAARMDWTIKPYAEANHNPVVAVNGNDGAAPILIEAQVGQPITLDAGASKDPDGHKLSYHWFHYEEAGFVPGANLGAVTIAQENTAKAIVTATATCRPAWLGRTRTCQNGIAHIILAVTDNGSPALTSYRRVIMNIRTASSGR
jgi:cellulose-binding protein